MIIINNVPWLIAFVPAYSDELRRPNGELSYGVCDGYYQTIFINEQLNGDLLRDVLCHELVHAAMFSYGVSLSIEQEELIASLITTYGEEIIEITNKIFNKLKERY
jgi:hypothetical protein